MIRARLAQTVLQTVLLTVLLTGVAQAFDPPASLRRPSPAVEVDSIVNELSQRSSARGDLVPVYREEREYIARELGGSGMGPGVGPSPGLAHHAPLAAGCCDDRRCPPGLWSNYCFTRDNHWGGFWLFGKGCGGCGGKKSVRGPCRSCDGPKGCQK